MLIDEDNLKGSILKLALPVVAEQSLMMVVGVVSTIFVGRLSTEAISAVGLVNTLIGFIQVIFIALSTGCTVLVARLIGEADYTKAKDTVKQSIALGIASSMFITVFCLIFSHAILNLLFNNVNGEVIKMANQYFLITLFSFPFFILNIMISGILRGSGNTKTPMYIAYIVNAVNIALNFILIFGIHLPNLDIAGIGLTGAAIATAVSRGIGGILAMSVMLFSPRNEIKLDLSEKYKINFNILQRLLKIGIPAALEQVIMQGGFLLLQVIIAGMGTASIAVYQIGMSINSICFIPVWGFGIAATTMIGQCLGADKADIAEKCGWDTLKIGLVVSTALAVVIFILAGFLMHIYSSDPEVIRIGTNAIRIFSISQPLLAVVMIISNALRGAGDIMFVTISSLIGIWGLRILMSIVLNNLFGIGIYSVWIALCFDYLVRAIMYMFRYRRGRWKLLVV